MSKAREIEAQYAIFQEGMTETTLSISIKKTITENHGTLFVLRQGDNEVMFPANFAKVIKKWAKGEMK
jgi:hypothetical protein